MSGVGWALLFGCGPSPSPNASGPPSVVLVTLDTTRADHLGAYGYERAHTPVIDGLAAEGVRFDAAYTTVPLTTPAHASILTGLYPARHGIHTNGDATLPGPAETLAERLADEGYATAASVGAFVTTRMWRLDQGFDAYFDTVGRSAGDRWSLERSADQVTDDLLGWLDEHPGGPFLVWAHYYDPHEPHEAPEPWPPGVVDAYDAEIASVDAEVGRLVDRARAVAGESDVLVVVVGDHGEALKGEHGEFTHGLYVFEPTVRVPLVVSGLDADLPGRVEAESVSVVDVLPTTLGWLGLDVPVDVDGVDLSSARRGPLPERAPVVVESETPRRRFGWHPELAVVDERDKLFATPSPRLYDLALDPEERHDRLTDGPDPARDARVAELHAVADEVRAGTPVGAAAPVADDAAIEAQLAALGYVTGHEGSPSDIDAKDRGSVVAQLQRAAVLRQANRLAEARAAFEAVLIDEPSIAEARLGLASVLRSQGQPESAWLVLSDAIARQPDSTVLRTNRAQLSLAMGRPIDAEADARHVLEQVPQDETARQLLLRALAAVSPAKALEQLSVWRVAGDDPTFLDAFEGQLELAAGRLDVAVGLLQRAAASPMPPPGVHLGLATVANARGDVAMTGWHLEEEVARYPADRTARRTLGDYLMAQRDWASAAAAYAELVGIAGDDHDARRAWAQAVLNDGRPDRAAAILAPALGTDAPRILALQANILAALGQLDEASRVFARAERLAERRERRRAR